MSAEHATCIECGMVLGEAGEFHPYAFCILKKAGLDPWREMVKAYPQLPPKPPLIRDLPGGRLVALADDARNVVQNRA